MRLIDQHIEDMTREIVRLKHAIDKAIPVIIPRCDNVFDHCQHLGDSVSCLECIRQWLIKESST